MKGKCWSIGMIYMVFASTLSAAEVCDAGVPVWDNTNCTGYNTLRQRTTLGAACNDLWPPEFPPIPDDPNETPAKQPVKGDSGPYACAGTQPDDFYFYVVPDAQHYPEFALGTENWAECRQHMYCQAKGIADEYAAGGSKIAFVTHVGDLIENMESDDPNEDEWQAAIDTYDLFEVSATGEGTLPHSISIGNHDYDDFNLKPLKDEECFATNFGPERYENEAWWVGSSTPSSIGRNGLNMAQKFVGAAGEEFLHLNLDYYASDHAILWAQGILSANPLLPAVLTTHSYLSPAAPLRGRNSAATDDPAGSVLDGGGDNAGEEIYQKLVYLYPQIFSAPGKLG